MRGKASPFFRSFEAQSLPHERGPAHERSECFGYSRIYATTNLPGADLDRAATPQGCAPGRAHIKKIREMDRFSTAAADHP